jgi:hypothetical protein
MFAKIGTMSECGTTECQTTEFRTTECRILKCRTTQCQIAGMPNDGMPNFTILNSLNAELNAEFINGMPNYFRAAGMPNLSMECRIILGLFDLT